MTDTPNIIAPQEIQSALNQLWEKHKGTSKVRASLFNLIIYTKADYREGYLQRIAETVLHKYPCRMIFITEQAEEGVGYLRTFVSDIDKVASDLSIFCDIINFDVSGSYRERIPYLVLPHVSADLPIYLLWGADPTENDPIGNQLKKFATRTIFDSETVNHMTHFAKTILTTHNDILSDIGDLNWARFAAWRELLAYIAETKDKFTAIQEGKEIVIEYNNRPHQLYVHTKIQAAYFQAWLACKLKWKFEETSCTDKTEVLFRYSKDDKPIHITIKPSSNTNLPPGRILSLRIDSHNGSHLEITREESTPDKVKILFSTTAQCDLPMNYLLSKESTVRSISHEIYNQTTNETFIEVIKLISQYKEGIICS